MKGSRQRSAALTAALLVLAILEGSPSVRAVVRHAAYRIGILAPPHPIAAGQPLGTVMLTTLDGGTQAVRAQPGRRLLINVFATWCVPCQNETPFLAAVAPGLRRNGIDIIGVDQADAPGSVARFVATYGIPYPTYIDTTRSSVLSLDARVIPTTLLVDGDNVVRKIYVGPLDESNLLAMTRETR